jgi:hypothetical protein
LKTLLLICDGMADLERLAKLKRIVSKSELTEEKALELSTRVSESLSKRYEKML